MMSMVKKRIVLEIREIAGLIEPKKTYLAESDNKLEAAHPIRRTIRTLLNVFDFAKKVHAASALNLDGVTFDWANLVDPFTSGATFATPCEVALPGSSTLSPCCKA